MGKAPCKDDSGGGFRQALGDSRAFAQVRLTGTTNALIPACAKLSAALESGRCLFSEWPRAFQFCPLQEVDLLLTKLKNT